MRIIPLVLLVGLLVGVLGCSAPTSKSAVSGGGTLVLHLTWPTTRATRGIPVNTQGVRLQVFTDTTAGTAAAHRWVARAPGTTDATVTLYGVPFGSVLLMIEAFDTADETAATADLATHRLAVGSTRITVQQSGPTNATVTLVPANFTQVSYAVSRPVNGVRHIVLGQVGTADLDLTANLTRALPPRCSPTAAPSPSCAAATASG